MVFLQGYNGNGQLGDGTLVDKKVPTLVSGGSLWLDIEVGAAFACGIKTDSRISCWVCYRRMLLNLNGQLLPTGLCTISDPRACHVPTMNRV